MDTVRRNHLSVSPGVVAYLKMLVTLGTIRHQLATDYDLAGLARQFFGGLIREQGQSWLDPVRLLIGTRADPSLPLARLRARAQLGELRSADLRLTSDETGTFLNDVVGVREPVTLHAIWRGCRQAD
jgi:hypothetical protein